MIEQLNEILKNVLLAFYQPFWFSLLLAFLAMFAYMFSTIKGESGKGFRYSVLRWIELIRTSIIFRRLFILCIFIGLLIFRTLLNRNLWLNPLENVVGNWKLVDCKNLTGKIVFAPEPIENIILFVPLTFLGWNVYDATEKRDAFKFHKRLLITAKNSFIISLCIELLQLFLRLGTFQLSDLFFNTAGGIIGLILYWIYNLIFRKQS